MYIQITQDTSCPRSARHDDLGTAHRSALGYDGYDAASSRLDTARRAIHDDFRAVRHGGLCHAGNGELRLGPTIALAIKARRRGGDVPPQQGANSRAVHDLAVNARLRRLPHPVRIPGRGLVVARGKETTACDKPGVGADEFVHAAPETQALADEIELPRVATALPAPAPIPTRLFAGNVPLFDE